MLTQFRRTQSYVLHSSAPATVVFSGDFLEMDVSPDLGPDCTLAIEARTDTPSNQCTKVSQLWPQPHITEAVASKVRIVNNTNEPRTIRRHEHLSQVHLTTAVDSTPALAVPPPHLLLAATVGAQCTSPVSFSMQSPLTPTTSYLTVYAASFVNYSRPMMTSLIPLLLDTTALLALLKPLSTWAPCNPHNARAVFPSTSSPRQAGRISKEFDELEQCQVFRRPEDVGITVEYINPSFLVKKPSGGYRLVITFAVVGRYSKPQPPLMPDVDSTLRTIAPWKYVIKSELTRAFYQIPLSKVSMKYCGVATPFRSIRVYTRSAMGMPGSETALGELMCLPG